MISTRFVSIILGLVVLAAIPTTVHSYFGAIREDGRRVAAIDPTLLGMSSTPVQRDDRWARRVYGSHDWMERLYDVPRHGDIQLFVARSYDPKKLYHHPELSVAYKGNYTSDLRASDVTSLSVLGGLPVHVLRGSNNTGLVVYVLHYDGRFIDNPYLFQLRSSLELLVSPRREMTLFFVHDRFVESSHPVEGAEATRLLVAAIENFLEQE